MKRILICLILLNFLYANENNATKQSIKSEKIESNRKNFSAEKKKFSSRIKTNLKRGYYEKSYFISHYGCFVNCRY
jgi:hypothetical protein